MDGGIGEGGVGVGRARARGKGRGETLEYMFKETEKETTVAHACCLFIYLGERFWEGSGQ